MLTSPEIFKTLDKIRFKRPEDLTFVPPQAFGLRVVIRPLEADEQRRSASGGIILMDSTVEAMEKFNQVGTIQSIGPEAKNLYPSLNFGNYIVLPRYMGDEIYIKGTRFISIFAEAIVAVIENPDELINFSDNELN